MSGVASIERHLNWICTFNWLISFYLSFFPFFSAYKHLKCLRKPLVDPIRDLYWLISDETFIRMRLLSPIVQFFNLTNGNSRLVNKILDMQTILIVQTRISDVQKFILNRRGWHLFLMEIQFIIFFVLFKIGSSIWILNQSLHSTSDVWSCWFWIGRPSQNETMIGHNIYIWNFVHKTNTPNIYLSNDRKIKFFCMQLHIWWEFFQYVYFWSVSFLVSRLFISLSFFCFSSDDEINLDWCKTNSKNVNDKTENFIGEKRSAAN